MATAQERTYTVAEAAKALGMSASSIRSYSDTYSAHLSDTANRRPRKFTVDDLRVMAYVWQSVNDHGRTHEQTLERLPGALESFTWDPPTDTAERTTDTTGSADGPTAQDTALVPASMLRAAQTMLNDRQERITDLEEQLRTAQGRLEQLQHENGSLSGQLREMSRPWWKVLLGLRD